MLMYVKLLCAARCETSAAVRQSFLCKRVMRMASTFASTLHTATTADRVEAGGVHHAQLRVALASGHRAFEIPHLPRAYSIG